MQNKSKFSHLGRKPFNYAVICFFLFAVIPSKVLGQITHSVSFEHSDIVLTKEIAEDGNTYSKVSINNLGQTDEVSKPSLPIQCVRLIVPSEQNVETIVIKEIKQEKITVPYPIIPSQKPIPACIDCPKPDFAGPDPAVYESDKSYPSEIVKIIHDGYFDGSNHIVTVAIYPLQYQPASGILTFSSSIYFEIRMKSGKTRALRVKNRSVKNQEIYNSILKSTVDNPRDLLMYQTTPTLIESIPINKTKLRGSVPFYEYVIITSNSLKSYFDDFISWKIRKGLNVGVVTVEEIYYNYPNGDEISGIDDEAGSVRQYLSDAYQSGMVYALLAGGYTHVPIRKGYAEQHETDNPNDSQVPADLYFADFNGDWEYDGDERLGEKYVDEEEGDKPDYQPEIFVGRLPCENGVDITNWTEKVLKYEQNPGNGNTDYLTSSFWVLGPKMFWVHPDDIIPHCPLTFEHTVWDQDDVPVHTGLEIQTEMNNHGLINWVSHGAWSIILVKDELEEGSYVWTYYSEIQDPYEGALDHMVNTDYYSIVYSGACRNAQFDNSIVCMADAWLFFESICGPAILANSRFGYISASQDLQKIFYDLLTKGTEYPDSSFYLHLGISELISKARMDYIGGGKIAHYLTYSHNLFGCPETQIWTEIPSEFTDVSITDNGTSIIVNTGVSGCDICVCSIDDGETYHEVAHNTSGHMFTTSERPVHVTICKPNYIPYMTLSPIDLVLQNITVELYETINYGASNSITAAGDNTYFVIEGSGSAGGNVSMKTGNYISLLPGFEAQEGCSFDAYIYNPILSDESITGPLAFDYQSENTTETTSDSTTVELSSEDKKESIPTVFSCAQNYPNPFIRNTTIKYGLPKNCDNVKLTIFNLAGQAVKTLVNGQQSAGFKSVRWDGTNSAGVQVPQGIYFYVFRADNFEDHRKMVLLK
jgi:hypothetical protein